MKQAKELIVLAVLINVVSSFQSDDNNKIYWNAQKKIAWADFKGKADIESGHSAITDYGIFVNLKSQSDSIIFTVNCIFNKSTSWVKYGMETDLLLKHEQTHFDIAEVYARLLRKQLLETKFQYRAIQEDYTKMQKVNMDNCNKEQAIYDRETNHSNIKEKQIEWNEKIEKRLKELEPYKQFTITVAFKR